MDTETLVHKWYEICDDVGPLPTEEEVACHLKLIVDDVLNYFHVFDLVTDLILYFDNHIGYLEVTNFKILFSNVNNVHNR